MQTIGNVNTDWLFAMKENCFGWTWYCSYIVNKRVLHLLRVTNWSVYRIICCQWFAKNNTEGRNIEGTDGVEPAMNEYCWRLGNGHMRVQILFCFFICYKFSDKKFKNYVKTNLKIEIALCNSLWQTHEFQCFSILLWRNIGWCKSNCRFLQLTFYTVTFAPT